MVVESQTLRVCLIIWSLIKHERGHQESCRMHYIWENYQRWVNQSKNYRLICWFPLRIDCSNQEGKGGLYILKIFRIFNVLYAFYSTKFANRFLKISSIYFNFSFVFVRLASYSWEFESFQYIQHRILCSWKSLVGGWVCESSNHYAFRLPLRSLIRWLRLPSQQRRGAL